MLNATDMAPVKEKLRSLRDHMPDADDSICEFASMLADRLGTRLVPEGFCLKCLTLINDLQKGVNGLTGKRISGSLAGNPSFFYMALELLIPILVDVTCPEDFAESVKKVLEEVDRKVADQRR